MDKYLDSRFDRVEKALATLIDSIAKYNPSERLAQDLVAADRELAHGLKQLERHQNNHARIQQLRKETADLDAQTKDIIGALWAMRKEVKSTSTAHDAGAQPKYAFTTAELLGYARRISRNTLPPPGVTNGVDVTSTPPPPDSQTQTPTASFNGGPGGVSAAPTPAADASQPAAAVPSTTDLPAHIKPHINLLDGAVFYPWPTEDKIRMGALAAYQQLADRGINPRGYDPEEEERRRKEEEQARKEAEERAILEREEADRRMREERERMAREREEARRREAERSGSISGAPGGPRPAQPPKGQFTFLGVGDDDDDDDD